MAESSRSTDASLSRAIELASDALAARPAGLLTDFDGTVSPIVADPLLAELVDGASGALERLADRLAVVAIITGRAPLDARRMAAVPSLLVVGNHGIEWLEPGADEPVASAAANAMHERMRAALSGLPELDGVVVEDKGVSSTIHYRGAPDPNTTRRQIVDALGDPGDGIEVRHGRMSVELRPVGLGDKGAAARALVERFGLAGVVVMGDDLTDLDMFAAVAQLRDAGRVRGAIIGVGSADREAPADIVEAADVMLADPGEAALLLASLAARVS
ncbi:MAG TPA: trehalose-phosphatase [Candidatus Limnocylindria bacterium]|nr:trehalose-phosphatase [Candidatus Limnocylindria bacterium]